jgi:plasmid stabilization system protein ParE
MRRLLIHPQARVDLLEIWHTIAQDSVAAANRVADEMDDAIRRLVEMPGMGHTRSDVTRKGYRFWTVYSYVIGYKYDVASLTVARVIHGKRDFRRLFNTRR